MTLRTDLKALDEARRVVRVHGGVKSVEQVVGTDDLLSRRAARNAEAKRSLPKKPLLCCAPTPPCFWIPAAPPQQWPGASDQPMLIYTSGSSCAMEPAKLESPMYPCRAAD